MILSLSNLKNKKRARKVLGRGNGSGHGTFSGRGSKGQRARSGGKKGLKRKGFRQNLLNIPKMKGMHRFWPKAQIVKLLEVERFFDAGDKVTPGTLLEKGLIQTLEVPVKILIDKKDDKITKAFEIFDCLASQSVKGLIEKAGGKIVDEAEEPAGKQGKEKAEK